MDETDLWNCVVQWGKGQNEEVEKDNSEWKDEDLVNLNKTLENIIPLIRFDQILPTAFCSFGDLISKRLYEKVLEDNIAGDRQPNSFLSKGPRARGKLLNIKRNV